MQVCGAILRPLSGNVSGPPDRDRLALTTVVCVSANEVSSRVGDEAAILDLDNAVYYGLDPVGARIFELLAQPTPLHDVLATVLAEFEVDEDTVASTS